MEAIHMPHFSYKIHVLASEVLTDTIYFPRHYIQNIRINYGRATCFSSIKQVRQFARLDFQVDGLLRACHSGSLLHFSPSGDHGFPGAFRVSSKSCCSPLCDLNYKFLFLGSFQSPNFILPPPTNAVQQLTHTSLGKSIFFTYFPKVPGSDQR